MLSLEVWVKKCELRSVDSRSVCRELYESRSVLGQDVCVEAVCCQGVLCPGAGTAVELGPQRRCAD